MRNPESNTERMRLEQLELLDAKAAMRAASIRSRTTWDNYVRKGFAPQPIQLGPGIRRWLRSEVEGWLARAAADRVKPPPRRGTPPTPAAAPAPTP